MEVAKELPVVLPVPKTVDDTTMMWLVYQYRVNGLNVKEIAQKMNVSVEAIYKHLSAVAERQMAELDEFRGAELAVSLLQINKVIAKAMEIMDSDSDMAFDKVAMVILNAVKTKGEILAGGAGAKVQVNVQNNHINQTISRNSKLYKKEHVNIHGEELVRRFPDQYADVKVQPVESVGKLAGLLKDRVSDEDESD